MKVERLRWAVFAVLVFMLVCVPARAVDSNDLVAHWKFDEGEGTIAHDSAGDNDGIIYGAAWTGGILEGALDFNGVDDHVSVPYDPNFQLPVFTVSAWIWLGKDPRPSGSGMIVGRGEDPVSDEEALLFKVGPEGSPWGEGLMVGYEDSYDQEHYFETGYFPPVAIWTHVAATRDSNGLVCVYANGGLLDSWQSTAGPSPYCYQDLTIGSYWGNPPSGPQMGGFFEGKIDDVRLYDRALSAEEVEQIYDEVPETYYVDGVNGSDANDGLSLETAFVTIQKGVDKAKDADTVLVYPAVYTEPVDFDGKAITVQGVAAEAGAPIVETPMDYAFSFYNDEEPNSVLKNFVIRNSYLAAFLIDSAPTISNLTIVDNWMGMEAYAGSQPDISNCIFYDNTDGDIFGCEAQYSWVEQDLNEPAEPMFVDANGGDYHLLSERGRYWPEYDVWVLDEATSPCVDGGDPNGNPANERMPNGGRINMGVYGGTAYASMSEWPLKSDTDRDGRVSMKDFAILAGEWLEELGWLE